MEIDAEHKAHNIQLSNIGFVVIGRNEGERLRNCIDSIVDQILLMKRRIDTSMAVYTEKEDYPIVYVDSGSIDESENYARSAGCKTIKLDPVKPFTAARARNEGFHQLIKLFPQIEWIQFIDGDCSLQPGWLAKASAFLSVNPRVAIVCGRRREIYPQKSVYNALCDMEWDAPIGEVKACGGDFLARKNAIVSVNGFNSTMIAGEEPEMCFRLRKNKWAVWRIKEEMTLHDAEMTHFKQFWLRSSRAGFAYAERWYIHSTRAKPYCTREVTSICIWGGLFPALLIAIAIYLPHLSVLVASVYPIMMLRIFLKRMKLRNTIKRSVAYSVFTQIGKFPQFFGVMKFTAATLLNKGASIIEYK